MCIGMYYIGILNTVYSSYYRSDQLQLGYNLPSQNMNTLF